MILIQILFPSMSILRLRIKLKYYPKNSFHQINGWWKRVGVRSEILDIYNMGHKAHGGLHVYIYLNDFQQSKYES